MRKKYAERLRLLLSIALSLSLGFAGMPVQAIAETQAVLAEQAGQQDEATQGEQANDSSAAPESKAAGESNDASQPQADSAGSQSAADASEPEAEVPAPTSDIAATDDPITVAQLKSALGQQPAEGDDQQQATLGTAIDAVIGSVNLGEDLTGYKPEDNRGLAINMGIVDYGTDLSAPCTGNQFLKMRETVNTFKAAAHAQVKKPLFLNGMAQPIFPFTTGAVEEDKYSNADSNIIRYSVWVETNYDTDGDGKQDMVKAVVQLPRAAARGDYKAATIFEARPYISGCTPFGDISEVPGGDGYDMAKLHSKGAAHVPSSSTTTMEAAAKAKSSEWYYVSPYESGYDDKGNLTDPFMDYETLDWYDYYLCRGYAVVEAAGLGTRGSDGFETCGSDVEIDAFKCVIEWLHGDRQGFADREGTCQLSADWSNGNVGMTGRSYGGTTDFGLAQTGVEGLKTIVPVSGIASWYDYYNCQGTRTSDFPGDQLSSLAVYCAGRYIDHDDWETIEKGYGNYLHQLQDDTLRGGSDYSDVWANRDYTVGNNNFKCPALVVHGLNDQNVTTKHFEMMYRSLKAAGVNTKLLLHQGAHMTPNSNNSYLVMTGDQSYDDLLNRWFTHYLYDLDNGAQDMPEVLAQSNLDANVWNAYDSYSTNTALKLGTSADRDTISLSSDYAGAGLTLDASSPDSWRPFHEKVANASSPVNATFVTPALDQDVTIKGTVSVKFDAAFGDVTGEKDGASPRSAVTTPESDNMPVTAMLLDVSDQDFGAYDSTSSRWGKVPVQTVKANDYFMACGLDIIDVKQFSATPTKAKVIERGWVDLANPQSGFESQTASGSIKLEKGKYNSYTLYLQPNVYTVAQGHRLALVLLPYDQEYVSHDGNYTFDINAASVSASIPTNGFDGSLTAGYLPTASKPDNGNSGNNNGGNTNNGGTTDNPNINSNPNHNEGGAEDENNGNAPAKTTTGGKAAKGTGLLPKTSDPTSLAACVALAGLGAGSVALGVRARRRRR
jgi:X-Pro dipeptidyl-peptidase